MGNRARRPDRIRYRSGSEESVSSLRGPACGGDGKTPRVLFSPSHFGTEPLLTSRSSQVSPGVSRIRCCRCLLPLYPQIAAVLTFGVDSSTAPCSSWWHSSSFITTITSLLYTPLHQCPSTQRISSRDVVRSIPYLARRHTSTLVQARIDMFLVQGLLLSSKRASGPVARMELRSSKDTFTLIRVSSKVLVV